ncbi:TonB family C-terminal domain-containing protein [Rheinheimera pacifica]|uniref:Protein TonB n=1 Tax=Rheinheimera pacifica TaxID=173990 RepID=A0A1H6L0P9_9GAMM|nr:M56 family metallopeptidase [Rheinheimera pacifica]SEH79852.1 TonB family C-terminal domain-containing protein [Rheinheimera pacifica]
MTDYLLQMSVPLSLLLIALLLAQQYLLKPLGARTLYALWAAVPLLLLCASITSLLPQVVEAGAIKRYQVGIQQLTAAAGNINWLFWLWLAGVMLCSSFLLLSYISGRAQFNRAAPLSGTNTPAYCRQADSSSGPYITGLITPRIILPHDFFTRFDATQQRLILQHELTHWRRGDLHLNYLALVLVSLFWFNPLVWLAYRQYRNAQELACDALVTKNASKAERIAYGYALLSSTQQSSANWWPLTHHYGDFNTMKQRITQLQRQQGISKTVVLGAMALVIAATLLLQQPVMAGVSKTQQLAAVMRIEPRYPLQAAEQGISGYVQIKFDVDAQGKVINASVVKSSPEQVFDKEALRALTQWQYTATGKLHLAQMVQLDFELDTVQADIERVSVTPAAKKG